ncbi:nickel-responsive transcriptional regulator NikR [candidate division KSB1 bacterium]|nr:nickel-responsive transcriptional regulator NikR [candidate division KSB1 bacterium]
MSELIRFGISIEQSLLTKFDDLIQSRSYENRSEAIRDLIRKELVGEQWQQPNAAAVGTITIIYDHHVRELTEVLTSIQHDHETAIIASTHVHLDHHNCLEVIIVKGKTSDIRTLADQLISLKGVKHGQLSMTSSGDIG